MGYKVKNQNIEVETNLLNERALEGLLIDLPGEEESILDMVKKDQIKPVKKNNKPKLATIDEVFDQILKHWNDRNMSKIVNKNA